MAQDHRPSREPRPPSPLGLLVRVARGEGWRGVVARFLDRAAAAARRHGFRFMSVENLPDGDLPPALVEALLRSPVRVLDVLATEPRPDLGGVQTQFRLRLQAELRERAVAVLFPGPGGYRLEIDAGRLLGTESSTAIRRLAVEFPADAALDTVLPRALELSRAQILHVEQPLGLPWAPLRQAEPPLVLSLHDFGLFCSRPHLLERPHMAFCGFCHDDSRCTVCLRHDQPVDPGYQDGRRREAQALLNHAEAVVYPSAFLRDAYARLFDDLRPERQHVVAPASVARSSPGSAPSRPPTQMRGERALRVAFVGSFQPHKGSQILVDVLDRIGADPGFQWHILGGGDAESLSRLRSRSRVKVHGYYRTGHLAKRLRSLGIDVALILSIWPETYCMTLDECLRAGVPVLAFDHGAPAERLRRLGGGLLADPRAGASGITELLRGLRSGDVDRPAVGHAACELPDAVQGAASFRSIYEALN